MQPVVWTTDKNGLMCSGSIQVQESRWQRIKVNTNVVLLLFAMFVKCKKQLILEMIENSNEIITRFITDKDVIGHGLHVMTPWWHYHRVLGEGGNLK